MSEERDAKAGAPVEQAEATETQVLAAVERAAEVPASEATAGTSAAEEAESRPAGSERPVIAEVKEPPSAGEVQTAEEIFASHTPKGGNPQVEAGEALEAAAATTVLPEGETEVAVAAVSTEGAATAVVADAELGPERDGEIRISADHPMAALYMQTPIVPDMKGNRGSGVLIALLATVAFGIVYAGALALWLAPNYPPSTFLNEGLLPWIVNWGFAAAAAGFFIGMALLVLIVGRAGWWAYVLGGLLVAAFTWGVALLGFAFESHLAGVHLELRPYPLVVEFGLFFPVIAAALVAREVAVWFGAWIGARGRKAKRQNAEALEEYEKALAEVQAKQP